MTTAARSSNIDVTAGETVTCTFTNRKRGKIVVRQGRGAQRRRRTSPSPPAAASAPRASSSTTTPTATLSNTRTFADVVPGGGYSVVADGARRLGPDSATCDDGSPPRTSTSPPARPSPARSPTHSAASIMVVKDAQPERPAGLHASRPAAASAPRASSSTTTPTARCRTRARSRRLRRARLLGRPRPCRPAGTSTRATCDDGSPVVEHLVAAGRDVTCTFTNRKRGRSWSSRTRSPTTRRTSPSRPAAASARRASSSTTTPTRRCRTRGPSPTSRPGSRLLGRADAADRLGARPRPRATTAARCPTSTSARARRSPARSPTTSAGRSWWSRTRRPTTRRTSPSRPAAASARRASSSTTTPTGRCRTRARSTTWRRAPATPLSETVPSGWDQTARDLRRRQPVVEHRRVRRRDGHLHVRQPQARQDRGRQGRDPERPAGLQLHRGRRPQPGELPARRRLRRRRCPTRARSTNVTPGAGYSVSETAADRLEPGRARPATTAARSRTSTWRPARPSRARSSTSTATRGRRARRR